MRTKERMLLSERYEISTIQGHLFWSIVVTKQLVAQYTNIVANICLKQVINVVDGLFITE